MNNDVIRIGVGCSANGEDAESLMVLDYSLHKNTDRQVELHYLMQSNDPTSFWFGWDSSKWATPFSGFRWSLPEYAGFQGEFIYMDSDMMILSDIGDLWDQEFKDGKIVMSKGGEDSWRFCVCKWNCAAAQPHMMPVSRMRVNQLSHHRMMNKFSSDRVFTQAFKGNWNCVDGENLDISDIDILHYSSMSHQPHLKYAIPRLTGSGLSHWFDGQVQSHWRNDVDNLFDTLYNEAIQSGYKVEDYIPDKLFGSYIKESQKNYSNAHRWVG